MLIFVGNRRPTLEEQPQEDPYRLTREAAAKAQPMFANRIYALPLGEGLVRFSFGETLLAEEAAFHTSIVTTPERALEFADIIARVANATIAFRAQGAEHFQIESEDGSEPA